MQILELDGFEARALAYQAWRISNVHLGQYFVFTFLTYLPKSKNKQKMQRVQLISLI